jgi:hypothetical protein
VFRLQKNQMQSDNHQHRHRHRNQLHRQHRLQSLDIQQQMAVNTNDR